MLMCVRFGLSAEHELVLQKNLVEITAHGIVNTIGIDVFGHRDGGVGEL